MRMSDEKKKPSGQQPSGDKSGNTKPTKMTQIVFDHASVKSGQKRMASKKPHPPSEKKK
jgi:hypothetical protein